MIIFTISTSLEIILHGGTFFIFFIYIYIYFFLGGGGGVAKLGALYNIDFRV